MLPLLPQGKKRHELPPEGIYTCVVPPRGYACVSSPRLVATVTARDYFPTTGDKRVLVSNNSSGGFPRDMQAFPYRGRFANSCYRKKKVLLTAHFSYLCVTVSGSVRPWKIHRALGSDTDPKTTRDHSSSSSSSSPHDGQKRAPQPRSRARSFRVRRSAVSVSGKIALRRILKQGEATKKSISWPAHNEKRAIWIIPSGK